MLAKLTTLLVVDRVEDCLPTWEALGYRVSVRVPETGPAAFAILTTGSLELMLQTKASLAEDLPSVAKLGPTHLLYADVGSLDAAKRALPRAKVLVAQRTTSYGATEAWLEVEDGVVLGLSEYP